MFHKVSWPVFSTWIETIRKGFRKKGSSEGHQADCAKAQPQHQQVTMLSDQAPVCYCSECEWLAQPVTGIAIPRARDWRLCRAFILQAVLVGYQAWAQNVLLQLAAPPTSPCPTSRHRYHYTMYEGQSICYTVLNYSLLVLTCKPVIITTLLYIFVGVFIST